MSEADVDRGLNIVILEVARGRMNEAYKSFQYASDNATKAEAEVARLTLLKLAGEIKGLDGMTFETQYEYDDEGGYFRTLSCYPTFEEDEDYDYDEYEFIDLMNGFTPEAICRLCDVPGDSSIGPARPHSSRRYWSPPGYSPDRAPWSTAPQSATATRRRSPSSDRSASRSRRSSTTGSRST